MTQAKTASVRETVSAEEWQTRVELAAAYRLVALYGWDDLVFTHISARVPNTENEFLINPYGFLFDEITASSLVKIDLQGNKLLESPYFINPAGFTIHGAIHETRHDVGCVLHIHSLYGVAVSTQADGLLPISQQSILPLSNLAYHNYEGVALNEEEKPRFAKLKANQSIETITMEQAMELFQLPRSLGEYNGEELIVNVGRYGPYVKYKEQFISLAKTDEPLEIDVARAIELIEQKNNTLNILSAIDICKKY